MSRGVRSRSAAFPDSASAWGLKLTHGILPFPPERAAKQTSTQRNQVRREEIKSTYLPLHRPLHAASVQSKSRTEIISGRTGTPVPVLFVEHSWGSTFTRLGGAIWIVNRVAAEVPGLVYCHQEETRQPPSRPCYANNNFEIITITLFWNLELLQRLPV